MKTLSILGYVAMTGGILALCAAHSLFSSSPFVIAAQVAALLLFLWARITFGRRSFHLRADPTAGGLVMNGPYRLIRHPIYTSFSVIILAGVIANWSWPAVLLGGLALAGAGARIFCEERLVVTRYPEYAQYAAKTWRMIPYVF